MPTEEQNEMNASIKPWQLKTYHNVVFLTQPSFIARLWKSFRSGLRLSASLISSILPENALYLLATLTALVSLTLTVMIMWTWLTAYSPLSWAIETLTLMTLCGINLILVLLLLLLPSSNIN